MMKRTYLAEWCAETSSTEGRDGGEGRERDEGAERSGESAFPSEQRGNEPFGSASPILMGSGAAGALPKGS